MMKSRVFRNATAESINQFQQKFEVQPSFTLLGNSHASSQLYQITLAATVFDSAPIGQKMFVWHIDFVRTSDDEVAYKSLKAATDFLSSLIQPIIPVLTLMDNHQFCLDATNPALPSVHFGRDVFTLMQGIDIFCAIPEAGTKRFECRWHNRLFNAALRSVIDCNEALKNNKDVVKIDNREALRFDPQVFSIDNQVAVMKAAKARINIEYRYVWEGSEGRPGMRDIMRQMFESFRAFYARELLTIDEDLQSNSTLIANGLQRMTDALSRPNIVKFDVATGGRAAAGMGTKARSISEAFKTSLVSYTGLFRNHPHAAFHQALLSPDYELATMHGFVTSNDWKDYRKNDPVGRRLANGEDYKEAMVSRINQRNVFLDIWAGQFNIPIEFFGVMPNHEPAEISAYLFK